MADVSAGEKLKVFISYSRKDCAAFADELVAGLEYGGFAPFLDRHDIAAGEEWEARLGGLIEQSDTVVFIVSPEAIKSDRCVWEVDKAHALSKRLLPVIHISVPDNLIPEKLSRLQFVRFDDGRGVTRPLTELAEALRVDLNWIREHTRLGESATRWDRRGRPESLLLRGDDVDAAKAWMAARNAAAPEITDVQRAFVKASQEAETKRLGKERAQRRRIAWLLAILVSGSTLGLIAWIYQSFIGQQANWYWKGWPYKRAHFDKYVLTAERERALKPKDSFTECDKDCPLMIVVPAGEFTMGSPKTEKGRRDNEGPQHSVMIAKPFAVSVYDVTFADWDACHSVAGCPEIGDTGYGRATRPVIMVSWDQARQYVAWLAQMTGQPYRLLTEAEWENAARAGSTTAYFWGDEKPNAFGLYDVAGNVWQWVQDCYHDNYDGAPTNGSEWTVDDCKLRVIRGGAYGPNPLPEGLRSAYRFKLDSSSRNTNLGFRLGRTLTP